MPGLHIDHSSRHLGIRIVCYPIAEVDVDAIPHRDARRNVPVSHDDNIAAVIDRLARIADHSLLFAVVLLRRVIPAGTGCAARQTHADVGMKPSIRTNSQRVAQDRLHESVPPIVLREPVAVMEEDAFSLNNLFERCAVKYDADLRLEKVSHPAIVIAHEVLDRLPGVRESLQGGECPVEPPGDHRCVIKPEIEEIAEGKADKAVNVIMKAPHTVQMVTIDEWTLPYSRQKAAFPMPWSGEDKYWPTVTRIDDAYGDRNLACSW